MDSLDQYTEMLQRSMRENLNDSVNKALIRPHDILTSSHEKMMRDLTDPRRWYLADSHRELVKLMQQARIEQQNRVISSHSSKPTSSTKSIEQKPRLKKDEDIEKQDRSEVVPIGSVQTQSTGCDLELKEIDLYQRTPEQHSQDGLAMHQVSNGLSKIMISDVDTLRSSKSYRKSFKQNSNRPLPSHRQKVVTLDENGNAIFLPKIKSKSIDSRPMNHNNIAFVENWIQRMDKHNDENMLELGTAKQSQTLQITKPDELSRSYPVSSLQARNRILSQLSLSRPATLGQMYNIRRQPRQKLKPVNFKKHVKKPNENHSQMNQKYTEQTSDIRQTNTTLHNELNLEVPPKQHIKTFLLSLMDAPNGISDTRKRYIMQNGVYTNEDLLSAVRKGNMKHEKQDLPKLNDQKTPSSQTRLSVIDLNSQDCIKPYTGISRGNSQPGITRVELLTPGKNEGRKSYTYVNADILKKQTMKPMKTFIQLQVFDEKLSNESEAFQYPLPSRRTPRKLGSLKTPPTKKSGECLRVTGSNDNQINANGSFSRKSRNKSKTTNLNEVANDNVVTGESSNTDSTQSSAIESLKSVEENESTTNEMNGTNKHEDSFVNTRLLNDITGPGMHRRVGATGDHISEGNNFKTQETSHIPNHGVSYVFDNNALIPRERLSTNKFMPTLNELQEDASSEENENKELEKEEIAQTELKEQVDNENGEESYDVLQTAQSNTNYDETTSVVNTEQINCIHSQTMSQKNVTFKLP